MNTISRFYHQDNAKRMRQTWFLLCERMSSSGCYLEKRNLTKTAITLFSFENFKKILDFDQTDDVEFWLTSDSLHTAERVPSESKLALFYMAFCKNDSVVTIIARRKSDPTSDSSSQQNVLDMFVERIKLWGHVWNESGLIPPERVKHLTRLAIDHPHFEYNAPVFIHDLVFSTVLGTTRRERRFSRNQLTSVHRPFYLGRPYFSDEVVAGILNTPIEEYTLLDVLNVLSRQARCTGKPHGLPEIRHLIPLFLYAFGWTLNSVPEERLDLTRVPEPQRKRKESQRIVGTWRKKASRLMKNPDMPKVQVPKLQPKRKIWYTRDIKGKSRVAGIVSGEESY